MTYTHFRLIAWEVPTVTWRNVLGKDGEPGRKYMSGWNAGQEPQAVQRLPVSDSVTNADARIRLKRLAGVVDAAATYFEENIFKSPDTLKIFMVPEFYFRPPTLDNSYSRSTYPLEVIGQIQNALDPMFVADDFKDWLFVCGTILWNSGGDEKERLYQNTALCHLGGTNQQWVIHKEMPASIDGIPKAGAPGAKENFGLFLEQWSIRKQRVFEVEGIRFGLEVCLDHLNSPKSRVLKNVLSDWFKNSKENPPEIALHLLTAGGMSVNDESVSARIGGYILRDDGMAVPPPSRPSELKQVKGYEWSDRKVRQGKKEPPTAADLEGAATLDRVQAIETYDIPAGPLRVPIPDGHKEFPQRIVFYPALKLPSN